MYWLPKDQKEMRNNNIKKKNNKKMNINICIFNYNCFFRFIYCYILKYKGNLNEFADDYSLTQINSIYK